MNRTTHDVQQGTGPWLRLREGFDTASEAPAALGVSKYVRRTELLRRKHTGIAEEHSAATLRKFAAGHKAEAEARPLAEHVAEGDLYPTTMSIEVEGLRLLASLDGQKLEGDIIWETKLWNEELAAAVRAGTLPEHFTVQMDQELLVSGADRCLFTCTDGTPERFVSCWYAADPARFEALIAGWHRFKADLAAYALPPSAPAAPVGNAPQTLPALRIEVSGQVTASNLGDFKETALAAIRSVNRELTTDEHFANAELAVKWCGDVETRIEAAKQHALSQTASIDELFKTMDDIAAEARRVRLDLNKLVTERKAQVKVEIVSAAMRLYEQHEEALRKDTGGPWIVLGRPDFAGAIKGMRSVDSVQNAVDTTLAAAKIRADESARKIRESLRILAEDGAGFEFLFADRQALIVKAPDDLRLLVESRIDTHKAMQAEKKAAEAARVAAAMPVPAAAPVAAPAPVAAATPVRTVAPAPKADEPATLKLGVICDRLGFAMTGAFVAKTLGIEPVRVEGAAKLYRESDFARVCAALQNHIANVSEAVVA